MSQEQNIFQSQTTDQNVVDNNNNNVQNTDQFANLLGSIKNERGEPKYKDLPTALDALKHSQDFIPQLKSEKERLEQELARMREENARLKAVEETVERLTKQQPNENVNTNTNSLDPDAIVNLVNQALTQKEKATLQKNNVNQVVGAMQAQFGAEAEKVFYEKAQELGMAVEEINSLAAKSPAVVLKLFGVETKDSAKSQFKTPTSGSVNTTGITPQKETFIGRNTKPVILGASSQELGAERENAVKLVEELHAHGLSTHDLTDPKQYFKFFGK